MPPEHDRAIAGVSGTITDLAQQQLSAEQIHQIGASRIRALITQIPQINASQYPRERRQLEHIRANIKTRIDLVQVAIEVAQTQQNAGRAKELEQTRSALTDLNDALALQGVIKQRFAEGGTIGEVAGRAIGTLETAGDRLGILLRDQSTPVQIAANAGLIAAGAAVLWIIWRNAETGVLRIGAGLATILAGGAAYLGIPAVRNMFDNMAQRMQKTQKEYAAQLKSAQELKELNATIEKNRAQTEEFLKQFNALRTPTSQRELGAVIGQAQAAVKIEKDLLTNATIGRFPEARQNVLRDRIQALDKVLADLTTEETRLNNLNKLQSEKKVAAVKAAEAEKEKNDAAKRGMEPVSKAERQPVGKEDRDKVEQEKIRNDAAKVKLENENKQKTDQNNANNQPQPPTQNPNPTPETPMTLEQKILSTLRQLPQGPLLQNPRREYMVEGLRFAVSSSGLQIFRNSRWQIVSVSVSYDLRVAPWVPLPLSRLSRIGDNLKVLIPGIIPQRFHPARTEAPLDQLDLSDVSAAMRDFLAGRLQFIKTLPSGLMYRISIQ